jgi:hypothetical protein
MNKDLQIISKLVDEADSLFARRYVEAEIQE